VIDEQTMRVHHSHGARPVHLIITMIKWTRTSRLSIKNSLSGPQLAGFRRAPVQIRGGSKGTFVPTLREVGREDGLPERESTLTKLSVKESLSREQVRAAGGVEKVVALEERVSPPPPSQVYMYALQDLYRCIATPRALRWS